MTTNNHPAHGPVSLDRLHQISEILSKAAAQSDGGNLGYAMADAVKVIGEVLERRKADSAEPACYALTNMAGEVYNTHSSAQNAGAYRDLIHQSDDSLTLRVTPLYAFPPASVTGIYDDVLNIIGLLENNEWAEHCTSTVLGSLLESEITRLVSKEQPAPVVPQQ
ncbi:hypothetical protein ACEXSZ_000883 [Salmonella enterica]